MIESISSIFWEEKELKCGTRVYCLPKREFPLSTILLLIKAGSVMDPLGKEGLARLVFKSMITGTKKMDSKTLSFEIERIGATLDVFTSKDFSVFTMELLSKNVFKGMEILTDIILNPSFVEEEIEKEKEKALNILKEEKDDPALIATRSFFEIIFSKTPYAHPSIGYRNSIKKIGKEDIVNFYNEKVRPQNAFIVLVGEYSEESLKIFDDLFSSWESSLKKDSEPEIKVPKREEFLILNDPDSVQTQIRMGKFSPIKREDEDFIPLVVGNAILGNLFTSRLVSKIRGELGLSYAVNSSLQIFKYGGLFSISTFTKNESVYEIIDAIKKEVDNFVEKGIREEELSRVKKFIKGKFPSSLQTNSELAGKIAEIEFYNLSRTYLVDFIKKVEGLEKKEVERAVKKHLSTENFSILVLGKADEIGEKLASLGKFNIKELKDV